MTVFNFTTTECSITVYYGDFPINASVGVGNNTTNSETLKFHEKILIAVFAGILAFITMVGNLLVMTSFGLNKKLRILNNYFLASLSIADFSIGLISMPLYTVYMIVGYWPFGALPCDLWLCLDYVMSNASALHLLLICLDRFFSAKRPMTYRANRTSSKVLKMIIISWIISALLWLPWIFAIPYVEGGRTVPETECYIQFLHSNDTVTIVTHVLAFWLPIGAMSCFYQKVYHATKIHKRFKSANANQKGSLYTISNGYKSVDSISTCSQQDQNLKKLDRQTSNESIASSCSGISNIISRTKSKGHSERENDKAAKTLSAILLAFIVTWMPYHVNVIISCFCVDCVPNAFYHFGGYFYVFISCFCVNCVPNAFYYFGRYFYVLISCFCVDCVPNAFYHVGRYFYVLISCFLCQLCTKCVLSCR